MGRFVVDFYCAELRLVVEVDGGAHRDRVERDAERQDALEKTGVRFLRFAASDVEDSLPTVLGRLRSVLLSPSPLVGEGAR
jgi:very-short-patch-repair endonuclease